MLLPMVMTLVAVGCGDSNGGTTEYTITATADQGGSIEPSGEVKVVSGNNVSFAIAPELGYDIKDVKVDGESEGAVAAYMFYDVDSNHVIETTFESYPIYTIMATAGPGGSIEPSGVINITSGNNITFTITAEAGYGIKDVEVDGVWVGAGSSYTFQAVGTDHTILATFENE